MKKLAVLISDKGTGTNLQAIIDACKSKKINAKIVVVVSDTKNAQGLKRAKKHKLKIDICPKKENLLPLLKKYQPDLIALAGWKQIITDEVIDTFKNKILNIHPGLIPDLPNGIVKNPDGTYAIWNKGKLTDKAIQNFFDQKTTYAGSSIHFLTHQFDFGPVLGRCFEKIRKKDTVDSLYTRLKKKEHEIYVKALQRLCLAKVLVIDGGGRGSVLVDKYSQSLQVGEVLSIPGNDLMLEESKKPIKIFPDIKTTDIKNILRICETENVDLIDVAQDDAVAVGVADTLTKNGFRVFGPTKAAGQIEWDKAWGRNFMKKNKIPSPAYRICKSEKEGINFIRRKASLIDSQKENEWFIKASGLAAGKGAIYVKNNKEAKSAIDKMKTFGKSGKTYLIEQCLHGEEFSSFAITDGQDFIIVGHAQDHKRVFDGDRGPNTGGMGCSSPPMVITKKIEDQIKSIFKKALSGLSKIGRPYRGILYLGGMIVKKEKPAHRSPERSRMDEGRVFVIEFNARWGDPEAEVLLPAVKNDLYEIAIMITDGKVKKIKLKRNNLYRVAVTACAKGYPTDYSKVVGKQTFGLDSLLKSKDIKIFGAGVKKIDNKYVVSGGRLFHLMASGKNVQDARTKAYNALSKIKIEGNNLHYRNDIGHRDLKRTI